MHCAGAVLTAYYIPAGRGFDAVEVYREVFLRRYQSKNPDEFKINAPCEFRFVTIEKGSPVLFDVPAGEYAHCSSCKSPLLRARTSMTHMQPLDLQKNR